MCPLEGQLPNTTINNNSAGSSLNYCFFLRPPKLLRCLPLAWLMCVARQGTIGSDPGLCVAMYILDLKDMSGRMWNMWNGRRQVLWLSCPRMSSFSTEPFRTGRCRLLWSIKHACRLCRPSQWPLHPCVHPLWEVHSLLWMFSSILWSWPQMQRTEALVPGWVPATLWVFSDSKEDCLLIITTCFYKEAEANCYVSKTVWNQHNVLWSKRHQTVLGPNSLT
jgi:hypothetical protein